MPEIYPLQEGQTYAFYRAEDKEAAYAWKKLDRQGERTKGFAYCQNRFVEDQRPLTAVDRRFEVLNYFLPGKPRPGRVFVNDDIVDLTLIPQPYQQQYSADLNVDYIIEDDKAVYRVHRYF
jgi:hypothetical protein